MEEKELENLIEPIVETAKEEQEKADPVEQTIEAAGEAAIAIAKLIYRLRKLKQER